jgi:ubiquinone/menaquinone biosynthesis C-methylase UbiE
MNRFQLKFASKALFLWMLLASFQPAKAQEPEDPRHVEKDYKRAIQHFGHGYFSAFYDQIPEVPESYAGLSPRLRFDLQWSRMNPYEEIIENMLELMTFEQGDVVADIGIGNGSIEAALYFCGLENVRFIGLDIDSTVLTFVPKVMNYAEKFREFYNASMQLAGNTDEVYFAKPENFVVETLLNDIHSTRLPDASVDKMICIRTLHHLSTEFLQDMARSLKPGGQLLVIESLAKKENKRKCSDSDSPLFYLTAAQVDEMMEAAGLEMVNSIEVSGGSYLLFEKMR